MTNTPSLTLLAAEYIKKHGLTSHGDHILAAVSGGPDSVALLHILVHLKRDLNPQQITVIHFDHRLRGDESDADRAFVRDLAHSMGLDFHCGAADARAFAQEKKISVEMAARELRHSFFRKIAVELKANRIALGHNANDQAEEVLLRLFRGTGPAGLQAMLPATRDGLIRPLLFATREAIIEYLHAHRIQYREDSTNSEPFCRRNLLRLKLFPLMQEAFHPEIVTTIARYAELAREEESWWAAEVEQHWDKLCTEDSGDRTALDPEGLKILHPALLRRVLRHGIEKVRGNLSGISMVHLEPLFSAIRSGKPGKSFRFPGGIEAAQNKGQLVIRKIQPGRPLPDPVRISGPGIYRFGAFSLDIGVSDAASLSASPSIGLDCVSMDDAKIEWPLELRPWRPGDRFQPLGMRGTKKLQDFFTDSRVPREERQNVPILCDMEKICWVAGFRMDDRVKVTPETKVRVTARLSALDRSSIAVNKSNSPQSLMSRGTPETMN